MSEGKNGMILVLIALIITGGVVLVVAWMVNNTGYEAKRRSLKRDSDVKTLKNSLDMHFLQENFYPTFTGCITGEDALIGTLVAKGLLRGGAVIQDPLDPAGEDGCYYYTGGGGSYEIRFSTEKTDAAGNPVYQYVQP